MAFVALPIAGSLSPLSHLPILGPSICLNKVEFTYDQEQGMKLVSDSVALSIHKSHATSM